MSTHQFQPTREQRRALAAENLRWPLELKYWPRSEWPSIEGARIVPAEVWRSRHFLVQIFEEGPDIQRMSVCRTASDAKGNWVDGIAWDELQRLKRECGRGERWAVEVFPADSGLVNVANMRHLWLLPERPAYCWGPDND